MTAYGYVKAAFAGGIIGLTLMLLLLRLVEKKTSLLRWVLRILLLALIFLALDIHVIEPNWIQVRRVNIEDSALAAVAGDTRIVHIADIHIRDGLGYRERQLIRKVNAQKPDILFISGDILDRMDQLRYALELLESFKVRLGIFIVPGNTDHLVMDPLSFKRALEPAGVNVLINETHRLRLENGRNLWITGLDNASFHQGAALNALQVIPPGEPKIMLVHSPVIFDSPVVNGVNLVLAGDTHGGQVGIDFLVERSKYANRTPYMRGLFGKEGTQMYVTRGIGMKTLDIRFLCRPEVTVIRVKP